MSKRAFSFASLLGLAKAEQEDDKNHDDKNKKGKAKEPKDDPDSELPPPDPETEGDETPPEDEPEDDPKDKSNKSKKSKAKQAEEPDDNEGGEEEAATQRERARCAAIIAHGVANKCVRSAAVLAFDTSMSAKAAIASLAAQREDHREAGTTSLTTRMQGVKVPALGEGGAAGGDGGGASGVKATVQAILKAGAKARGEKA